MSHAGPTNQNDDYFTFRYSDTVLAERERKRKRERERERESERERERERDIEVTRDAPWHRGKLAESPRNNS